MELTFLVAFLDSYLLNLPTSCVFFKKLKDSIVWDLDELLWMYEMCFLAPIACC